MISYIKRLLGIQELKLIQKEHFKDLADALGDMEDKVADMRADIDKLLKEYAEKKATRKRKKE